MNPCLKHRQDDLNSTVRTLDTSFRYREDGMKPGKLLLALLFVPVLLLSACTTKRSEFTITDVTVQDVRDMAEDGDTFLLLVEREGCEFCQAMNDYIEETKGDHPEVHLFRLDTTVPFGP